MISTLFPYVDNAHGMTRIIVFFLMRCYSLLSLQVGCFLVLEIKGQFGFFTSFWITNFCSRNIYFFSSVLVLGLYHPLSVPTAHVCSLSSAEEKLIVLKSGKTFIFPLYFYSNLKMSFPRNSHLLILKSEYYTQMKRYFNSL